MIPTERMRVWLATGYTDVRCYAVHKIMSSPERQHRFHLIITA